MLVGVSLGTHARLAVSRVAGALGFRDCRWNHQDSVAHVTARGRLRLRYGLPII